MGKWRQPVTTATAMTKPLSFLQPVPLPPLPPLHPRPGFLAAGVRTVKEESEQVDQSDEPLDYSMKSLRPPLPSPPPPSSMSASPMSLGGASALDEGQRGGVELLHKLRCTLLHRGGQSRGDQVVNSLAALGSAHALTLLTEAAVATAAATSVDKVSAGKLRQQTPTHSAADGSDSKAENIAAYAAECIKSRLDGCGKRVHLFLGILLHFGMPPGPNGEQMFNRVISFSDEHKNLTDKPTPYFMVLDSKLLALVWSKFKGNSSNEYSTLTRAIRSTRQKYQGIFESVKNPGKKLYKFGPVALEQFRNLFPSSYQ